MLKTSSLLTTGLVALGAVALAAPVYSADAGRPDMQLAQASGAGSPGGSGGTGGGGSSTDMQNRAGSQGGMTGQSGTTGQSGAMGQSAQMSKVKADELLGAEVKNTQNETIGEIESVHLDQSGSVRNVIVSVGGFLGMGAREVALSWNDLDVSDDGQTVTTSMTKDQLKGMPEYQYRDSSQRGSVFSDSGSGSMGGTGTGTTGTQPR